MRLLLTVPPGLAAQRGYQRLLWEAAEDAAAPSLFQCDRQSSAAGHEHSREGATPACTRITTRAGSEAVIYAVDDIFCCADPPGAHLGSGAGAVHLLERYFLAEHARGSCVAPERPPLFTSLPPHGTAGSHASGLASGALTTAAFTRWLQASQRVLVHAGGQSRRLPAYATGAGKALVPIPPCPFACGQRLDQSLLSMQLPLLRAILRGAPAHLQTLIACGDVCVRARSPAAPSPWPAPVAALKDAREQHRDWRGEPTGGRKDADTSARLMGVPPLNVSTARMADPDTLAAEDADVVCFGVRRDVETLRRHGVFFLSRARASERGVAAPMDRAEDSAPRMPGPVPGSTMHALAFALQKPSPQTVRQHLRDGQLECVMDTGLWLLSARAVALLRARSHSRGTHAPGAEAKAGDRGCGSDYAPYDLYADFGAALGRQSVRRDAELNALSVAVVVLGDAQFDFLHFGTTAELLSSTAALHSDLKRQWRHRALGGDERDAAEEAPWLYSSSPAITAAPRPDTGTTLPAFLSAPLSPLVPGGGPPSAPQLGWTASVAHPTVFVQNAIVQVPFTDVHTHLWIENSYVGPRWTLHDHHVVTGVPVNDWQLCVPPRACVDVVPVPLSAALQRTANAEAAAAPVYSAWGTLEDETPSEEQTLWSAPRPPADGTAASSGSPLLYVARPYGHDDNFQGSIHSVAAAPPAVWMNQPLAEWLRARGLSWTCLLPCGRAGAAPCAPETESGELDEKAGDCDIQHARLFPALADVEQLGVVLAWMLAEPQDALSEAADDSAARQLWLCSPRFSAAQLTAEADIARSMAQRERFQRHSYWQLSAGGTRVQSFFYSAIDLDAAARRFVRARVPLPLPLACANTLEAPLERWNGAVVSGQLLEALTMTAARKRMFCARILQYINAAHGLCCEPADTGRTGPQAGEEETNEDTVANTVAASHTPPCTGAHAAEQFDASAFSILRESMTRAALNAEGRHAPRLAVLEDQIVWGRSPARLDLCGGWTDTPPYSVLHGGAVVNLAVELNGQPPVQVYVKLHDGGPQMVLRSIDLGSHLVVNTYDELREYTQVGSAFSIPKAALALAGFLPEFCAETYPSLAAQLRARFGGRGLEVTLLAAIPAGSGLGASSIVAGTVLQTLSVFCGLRWDVSAVCRRVLVLEQLLTTGGGWQDQYGGLFAGLKLVQSAGGLEQDPSVRWLPEHLLTTPAFRHCHLLYYTGLTRTAKDILVDIARGVFLNESARLRVLWAMRESAELLYDAVTRGDFGAYGQLIARAWEQNKALDAGTSTPQVEAILDRVAPYVYGAKLAGAGGGGYLLLVAKDEACVQRVREELLAHPPNARARFVDMSLSATGVQVSTS